MKEIVRRVSGNRFDSYEFLVNEEMPALAIETFTDWLTERIQDDPELSDGQTLQYGWSLLRCCVSRDRLQIQGPSQRAPQLQWTDDLTYALSLLLAHKYLPESFGFQGVIPGLQDTAVVGPSYDTRPMFIDRGPPGEVPAAPDSGWCFGSLRDDVDRQDPSQLKVLTLYEAVHQAPWIVDFLSLPPGVRVVFDETAPVVCFQGCEILPHPGSYAARRWPR